MHESCSSCAADRLRIVSSEFSLGIQAISSNPQRATDWVRRERLYRPVEQMAPVTFLEAAPGHGKTTLALAWAERLAQTAAHVFLLEPLAKETIVSAVSALSARRSREQGGITLEHSLAGHSDEGFSRERDRSCQHAHPRILVLVIEDVDPAEAQRIRPLLDLLSSAPASLRLLFTGSDADYVRAWAADRAVALEVITGAEMRIPRDDMAAFAAFWGHDLDETRAETLHAMTAGWIAPTRCILDQTPPSSSEWEVAGAGDYIARTISRLDAVDPPDAELLALPRKVTLRAAASLLRHSPDRTQSTRSTSDVVARLERLGLLHFEEASGGNPYWRFGSLVRSVLVDRLTQERPETARQGHLALAQALQAAGDVECVGDAMEHARNGEDWRTLSNLWAELNWQLAVASPETFVTTFADIPELAKEAEPLLHFPERLACALQAVLPEAEFPIPTIRRHYHLLADALLRDGAKDNAIAQYSALIAGSSAHRADGRLDNAERLAMQAEIAFTELRPRLDLEVVAAHRMWHSYQRGSNQLAAGNLVRAAEYLSAARELRPRSPVALQATSLLSMIHAIQGAQATARRELADVQTTAPSSWLETFEAAPAAIAQGIMALDSLDEDSVERWLRRIEGSYLSEEVWLGAIYVRTRQAILFGRPIDMLAELHQAGLRRSVSLSTQAAAPRLLKRCKAEVLLALGELNRVQALVGEDHGRSSILRLPAARMHLIAGNYAKANRLATASLWSGATLSRDSAGMFMVAAAATYSAGNTEAALTAFRRGHALAQRIESLEPYLWIPSTALADLQRLARLPLGDEADAAVKRVASRFPSRARLIELSPREYEILAQLRQSGSLASIARTLSVSVNTVKKQVGSIYRKLGVNDRDSALLRAEELGLIDLHTRPPGIIA